MPKDPEYIYWDSCMFLYYLENDPSKMYAIDDIIHEVTSSKGKIEIITSTFTIAEVAYVAAEKMKGRLDPQKEKDIENLWLDSSMFKLVDFHPGIAADARTLIRSAMAMGVSGLKAKDAVHIATAQSMGASALHTYDDKLHRHSQLAGLRIGFPEPKTPTMFAHQYYLPSKRSTTN